jgi:hypothetical protein
MLVKLAKLGLQMFEKILAGLIFFKMWLAHTTMATVEKRFRF